MGCLTEQTFNATGSMMMADVVAPPDPHGPAADIQQWLACQIGQERYLIAVTMIKEIIRLPDCTVVPRSPQWLRGICSLRGVVIAIIDVGVRLGLAACPMTAKSRVVVVSVPTGFGGLIVDRVLGLLELEDGKINTTPTMLAAPHREFIRGLAHHDDAVYVLLDLQRLLTFSERVADPSC